MTSTTLETKTTGAKGAGAAAIVETFRHPEGCVAYLVVDPTTRSALAIDPRLDQVDALLGVLTEQDWTLVGAIDTHTHADHLSGVRLLAEETGAVLYAHAGAKLAFEARRVRGGDTIAVGALELAVLDAPGHTPDSLALLGAGQLFTGDALFVDGTGRTDFPGGSASDMFDTLRRFEALPDATVVRPGHDYPGKPTTTIGAARRENALLALQDRAALAAKLDLKGTPPVGVEEVLRFNQGGQAPPKVSPQGLDALLRGGATPWVLDVRTAPEVAAERIAQAHHVPLAELEGRLAEVPADREVYVTCRTGVRATTARELLTRHGRRVRLVEGGMVAWRQAGLPVVLGGKHFPIDRQVQLIVGLSVLTSTLVGAFVTPWALIVAGFFGAGLAFAGATGTCGLAVVLGKLPWNRPSTLGGPTGGKPATVCAVGGAAPASTCAVGGAAPASTCAVGGAQGGR